jgi:hypothetical protein
MTMTLYIVESPGGVWSNDDEAAPGPAGVYSSRALAIAALRLMMQDELEVSDTGDEPVDRDSTGALSFEALTKLWAERLDTEEYRVFARVLDAPLIDVHAAGTGGDEDEASLLAGGERGM